MKRQRPVRYIRMPARPTRQRVQQRARPRRGGGGGGGCLRIGIALAMAAFALISFFGSQVYNPVTGEEQYITISQDQEIALGLQSAPQMAQQFGGLDPNPELQEIVDLVGQDLIRNSIASGSGYPFEFHLLADSQTVNAFALPGGQIFITRALFDRLETEGQLAGVLAHEVVHVIARHGAERIAEVQLTEGLTGAVVIATYDPDNPNSQTTAQVALLVGQLVNMKFGREDELQSDSLGVQIMADAGYAPNAMVDVMRILDSASSGARPPEFFSTHPNPSNRIARIQEAIARLFPNGVPGGLIPLDMDQSLRKNLRTAYNRQVAYRDGRVIEDWKVEDRSRFLDLLHLEGKQSLLEIGAGTGQDSAFFTEQGFQVSSIDLSPENVASCHAKGLDAQVMDMCDLRFEPDAFDAAFALNCLLHLPKSEFPTALRQINNVLKDSGVFYLGQYGGYESEGVWEEDNYDPPRFFSFFTDDAIQEFAEQVFQIEGFKAIKLSDQPDDLHFQSLTLRKRTAA